MHTLLQSKAMKCIFSTQLCSALATEGIGELNSHLEVFHMALVCAHLLYLWL